MPLDGSSGSSWSSEVHATEFSGWTKSKDSLRWSSEDKRYGLKIPKS